MIPYEELAAALERRAARTPSVQTTAPDLPPPSAEDNTLNGNENPEQDFEIGEVLSDEEAQ